MKKRFLIILIIFISACKKDKCWNSYGDESVNLYEFSDSFDSLFIGANIILDVYQDSANYMIIETGTKVLENMVIDTPSNTLSIANENSCNFLINNEKKTRVELHFSDYTYMKLETEEAINFIDTILTENLFVYYGLGSGSMDIRANVNHLTLAAYSSSGNFILSGSAASNADIRVQDRAWGDAQNFWTPSYKIYNNSVGDLHLNFDSSLAIINQKGTGHIYYSGIPDSLIILPNSSDGMVIPE